MAEYRIARIEEGWQETEREVLATLDEAAAALGKPFVDEGLVLRVTSEFGYLGGLVAEVMQGWLYVKYLALVPQARGTGVGGALMRRAEEWAASEGMVGVHVDTYDFQAPEFYTTLGYSEIGRVPATGGCPARMWYAKAFGPGFED